MLLRRCIITGFRSWDDEECLKPTFPAFKQACFVAARVCGGRAERIEPAGAGKNYHACLVIGQVVEDVLVLANVCYPLIGFAEASRSHRGTHAFIDCTDLAAIYSVSGFEILEAAQLSQSVSASNLPENELSSTDIEQIRYWNPRRIGDIIFNDWD